MLAIGTLVAPAGCVPTPAPLAPLASAPPCTPPPPLASPPQPPPPDRARLAAGLDAFLAGIVQSDRTDLTAASTPFLTRGRIWDLEQFGHAHPLYAHLGAIEGSPTVNLSSSRAFSDFARSAGLALDDAAARIAYVKMYLARDPEILWLVESTEQMHFTVPRERADLKLSAEEMETVGPMILEDVERRREVEARHLAGLQPICLAGKGPFHGVIHAIQRQQRLLRIDVTLERSGEITAREKLLAERVPVTVVYP